MPAKKLPPNLNLPPIPSKWDNSFGQLPTDTAVVLLFRDANNRFYNRWIRVNPRTGEVLRIIVQRRSYPTQKDDPLTLGRWYYYGTGKLAQRPKSVKWAEVPVFRMLPRHAGWVAMLEDEKGNPRFVHAFGPFRRAGLYKALVFQNAVVAPHARRVARARSPKIVLSDAYATRDEWYESRKSERVLIPRRMPNRMIIARWRIASDPSYTDPKIVYAESLPKEEIAHTSSSLNSWCYTGYNSCEATPVQPMWDNLEKYLQDSGFPQLRVLWLQRRYLHYGSDGDAKSQAGVMRGENNRVRRTPNGQLLLWEGEAWMLQLYNPSLRGGWSSKVITPHPLFISEDFTFLASYQCMRVGQTLDEYNRGINLYTPTLTPISLASFIRGPLMDWWNTQRKNKLGAGVKVYRPKPLPDKLKRALIKRFTPPPPPPPEFAPEAELVKHKSLIVHAPCVAKGMDGVLGYDNLGEGYVWHCPSCDAKFSVEQFRAAAMKGEKTDVHIPK